MTPHEVITSPANPRVRAAARLRDAEARRTTGLTLVDGRREIGRAVDAGIEVVEAFIDADAPADPARDRLLETLAARGTVLVALAARPFEKIAYGSRNEGVVGVVRFAASAIERFTPPPNRPVIVLEGVEKPGNLGAIMRTCDAAGIAGIIACGGGTDPANPAAIRASLGTAFTMPLAVASTAFAIDWCARTRRRVVAATPHGSLLWHDAVLAGPIALLLGSEAHGISAAWRMAADGGAFPLDTIRLPMLGVADSLNVAATAAVLAYETARQTTRAEAGFGLS